MAQSDQLDRYLNRARYFAAEVREKHPTVWDVAGHAIAKSKEVMDLAHASGAAVDPGQFRVRLGLWGSVRGYQINSLLEVFSRNLDEGLAILRMATELARTLKALTTDPALYATWTKNQRSPEFKAAARFDKNDPAEKAAYTAYEFSTKWGAHGHKTSAAFLENTFMGAEPNLEGVARITSMWFISFAPIHRLCLRWCLGTDVSAYSECDLALTLLEAKLLECVRNDGFFAAAI